MTRPRPIAVELFAGAGGLSLGLEQAGFDVVLAVDRDGYHVATHERNFPGSKALCRSVVDLKGDEIRSMLQTDEIDLVSGGPPCQGFSHMGFRDLNDPRNTLVDEFARLVVELKPKAVLMENVPGMQTGETGVIFDRAVQRLQEAGYNITLPVRTLNAMDFGVPQRRERLFLLGLRRDLGGSIEYPDGPSQGQPPRPTVGQAIAGLPTILDKDYLFKEDIAPYEKGSPAGLHPYVLVARGLAREKTDFSHERGWDKTRCSGCMRTKHRSDVQLLYASTAPGEMVPGHKLPRLDPDGLCPTLRAGSESEHGSYTAPRPIHPFEPRCITVREAARLHGYPDWFSFYPSKWHAYRQIGNSVCPPVGRALGRALLTAIGVRPRRPAKRVRLSDEFKLPSERPMQHRRITQLEEWPKIITYLFEQSIDARRQTLDAPEFSIDDVRKAYLATKAKMPRNPPERFLSDLARSRNVRELLKPLAEKGFSILPVTGNGSCGRFVPVGTPGSLGEKDSISVGTAEIAAARVLHWKANSLEEADVFQLLSLRDVVEPLFGQGQVIVDEDDSGKLNGLRSFRLLYAGRCRRKGIAYVSNSPVGFSLSKLQSVAARMVAQSVLLLLKLTRHHVAVLRLEQKAGKLVETRRVVFRVVRHDRASSSAGLECGTL